MAAINFLVTNFKLVIWMFSFSVYRALKDLTYFAGAIFYVGKSMKDSRFNQHFDGYLNVDHLIGAPNFTTLVGLISRKLARFLHIFAAGRTVKWFKAMEGVLPLQTHRMLVRTILS
jgi:hypothetical protein